MVSGPKDCHVPNSEVRPGSVMCGGDEQNDVIGIPCKQVRDLFPITCVMIFSCDKLYAFMRIFDCRKESDKG